MKCKNALELLSPYMDGRVSATEKVALEDHLSHCSTCSLELHRLRLVVQSLRELPAVPVPRSFALSEEQIGERPRSIFPYLQRATFALAAVFILMFVTSLYMQATSFSQRTQALSPSSGNVSEQAPVAMSARSTASSDKVMDSASTESASNSKRAESDVQEFQLQAAPERAAAPAAAPAPSAGASQSVEDLPSGVGGSVEPRLPLRKAEEDQAQALSIEKEGPKQEAFEPQNLAVQQPTVIEPVREIAANDGKWPLLEIEVGVLALLVIVGSAMLIVRRRERNPF